MPVVLALPLLCTAGPRAQLGLPGEICCGKIVFHHLQVLVISAMSLSEPVPPLTPGYRLLFLSVEYTLKHYCALSLC